MGVAQLAAPAESIEAQTTPATTTAQHIRGSSLLLVGRIAGQILDFGWQILLVRYLSKGDYGAFSYALSIVLLCKGVAMLEMPNTLSRFVPLYRERNQHSAVVGSIVLGFGVVAGLGALIAVGIDVGLGAFSLKPTQDPAALRLLMILAFLIPVEGLDGLLTALFATFASPRLIFFRQAVLLPGLRIGLILALVMHGADVITLTAGYLAVSALGVLVYGVIFVWMVRRVPAPREGMSRRFTFPAGEIFGFAFPMLASTLVWLLMQSSDALLLGYFKTTDAVATFRAVLPIGQLNQGVILVFTLLYTPIAARLYARSEREELSHLYWQTALWMTVLSFPIFVLTFSFALPTTVGVLGSRYSDSAPIMALLALGYFVQTSLGFNGLTVKIFKKLRYAVSIDLSAAALNVAVNLVLVPRWGALGAAIGTASTMIVHNLLKQYGLWRYTGISLFRRDYLLPYGAMIGLPLALFCLQAVLPARLWIALPLAVMASLAVLWCSRNVLQLETTFPELLRWPIVRAIARPLMSVR